MVALRDLLTPISRPESVNPQSTYRILGAHWYAQGLYIKDVKLGAEIRANKIYRIMKGDFVYNRLFAWKGSFAIATQENDNCYVSNEFPCFSLKQDRVNSLYLWRYFSRASVWDDALGLSKGGTPTSRNRLKEDNFLAIKIPLPPPSEQRRIVTRIEELAAKIEEAQTLRRQAVAETAILRNSIASRFLHEDLHRVRLEEVCSLITDGTHQTPRYTEDGLTFLSASNIKPFRFMPDVHRKVSYDDYRAYVVHAKPQKGDVLLTRVGAGIGEAAMIDRDIEFAFYVSLALIRPVPERLSPEFLVHWLNSPDGLGQSRQQTLGKGHSQGNLNLKLLRSFKIPLPSLSEQHRIVHRLNTLKIQIDALEHQQDETGNELDTLLPSIIDGAFRSKLS